MDDTKFKRWLYKDVVAMLNVIKNKNIIELMDGKHKRNSSIYKSIGEELRLQKVYKTPDQIKTKFKALRADFFKSKRHNAISGNDRKECEHYDLLQEILQSRPLASLSGMDLMANEETDQHLQEILHEDAVATAEIVENVLATLDSVPSSPATSVQTSPLPTPNLKTFRSSQKKCYQSTIASFNLEWKQMQEDVIKKAKEEDEKFLVQLQENDKKNLDQLEAMLQKDREQTMNDLKEILNSLSK